jgi:3-methyl-2-oxobutanoate hydroxymethyltransferase
MVVADMPFMSYQASAEEALRNAGRLMKEGGAQAVKLEGGEEIASTTARLTAAGVPVVSHIGLTPQHVHQLGGFKVQGKGEEAARKLLRDALALEAAGAFSVVMECVPEALAAHISQKLTIPTVGIGAGAGCDGQVLVYHDFLGLSDGFTPKFVKQYRRLREEALAGVRQYAAEVRDRTFPGAEHTFKMDNEILNKLY